MNHKYINIDDWDVDNNPILSISFELSKLVSDQMNELNQKRKSIESQIAERILSRFDKEDIELITHRSEFDGLIREELRHKLTGLRLVLYTHATEFKFDANEKKSIARFKYDVHYFEENFEKLRGVK